MSVLIHQDAFFVFLLVKVRFALFQVVQEASATLVVFFFFYLFVQVVFVGVGVGVFVGGDAQRLLLLGGVEEATMVMLLMRLLMLLVNISCTVRILELRLSRTGPMPKTVLLLHRHRADSDTAWVQLMCTEAAAQHVRRAACARARRLQPRAVLVHAVVGQVLVLDGEGHVRRVVAVLRNAS